MNKILNKILSILIPFRNIKRKYLQNNNVFFIKNGKEYKARFWQNKYIKYSCRGYNNTIKIEFPINKNILKKVKLKIVGDNKSFFIGSKSGGKFFISMIDDISSCSIGSNTITNGCFVMTAGQNIKIGDNCMIAYNVEILSDGHSIIDINTKELLNKPEHDLIVGNNVWLCANTSLMKNTIIPNGCIVANGAIVTKEFTEENCILAGIPAKIVKTNVSWDAIAPTLYKNN